MLELDGLGLVFHHEKKFNLGRKGRRPYQAERALELPRGLSLRHTEMKSVVKQKLSGVCSRCC